MGLTSPVSKTDGVFLCQFYQKSILKALFNMNNIENAGQNKAT